MPTQQAEEVVFSQVDMTELAKRFYRGSTGEITLLVPGASSIYVTVHPTHKVINDRGGIECLVLMGERYFSTTSSQKVQYFGVTSDPEHRGIFPRWLIPNMGGLVVNKRETPMSLLELVQQGLFSEV